jgi:hypothetical protein
MSGLRGIGWFWGLDRFSAESGGFGESLKQEGMPGEKPLSLEDAKRLIQQCVDHNNHVRLRRAIGT